ncbi:MAG: PEP-CTERM sorting domain-containing protein [Planctomycetaceae bacterium]|jgi:hypothetical protein|nr:PEP-CTERM sorting domain-containing protein [Planctomycetaceae bacterium]
MKSGKFLFLSFALIVTVFRFGETVRADLNAQEIVNRYNSASGGTSLLYTYSSTGNEVTISQRSGYNFVDTSAYAQGVTGNSTYYKAFCVEPTGGVSTSMEAKLNYANGKSQTSDGYALSLGAAYLYKEFAVGTLDGFNYTDSGQRSSDSYALRAAIRTLMGINPISNWSTNTYLSQLLADNPDMDYWKQIYDPGKYYDEIGNYSVFVMNCFMNNGDSNGQDFLYIAKAEGSVPEPTSLLLWGMGSLGLFGIKRSRKHRK